MTEHIINQIIIVTMQWERNGSKEHERQFESLLGQLQKVTGKNREQAIQMLYDIANVREDAA